MDSSKVDIIKSMKCNSYRKIVSENCDNLKIKLIDITNFGSKHKFFDKKLTEINSVMGWIGIQIFALEALMAEMELTNTFDPSESLLVENAKKTIDLIDNFINNC